MEIIGKNGRQMLRTKSWEERSYVFFLRTKGDYLLLRLSMEDSAVPIREMRG